MDKLLHLKAEVFDIIRKQEELNYQFQQLEKLKQEKLKEIQKLENEKNNPDN